MSTPKNQNVWNYVPPHRGAKLDGGTPSSLNNDNSVDGGWSDRSTLGSSTSGHVYVPEAPYDGNSFVRKDGEWRPLFEGTGAIDSFYGLIDEVESLRKEVNALKVQVENLTISAEGWQEERIQKIETRVTTVENGDNTFPKLLSYGNITAYVEKPEQ